MVRNRKPALALLAGLALALVSACSSSATPPAGSGGPSGPGTTLAPGATPTIAAPGTTPTSQLNPNDPNSIITKAISGGTAVKSFHIKIAISGTVNASTLSSAAGSAAAGLKGNIKLDGTAIEGDVDVANAAVDLTATVAAIPSFGNVPITAVLIVKNNVLYYKTSLTGAKFAKLPLAGLTQGLPVPTAAPGASAMAGVADEVAKLREQMQAAGVTVTLVGVDQIGGKPANHISISIPIAKLNAQIAASKGAPKMTIDSASADVWVYQGTAQLAEIEFKGSASSAGTSVGNIDFTITITNYDQPVTITAPPASEVTP